MLLLASPSVFVLARWGCVCLLFSHVADALLLLVAFQTRTGHGRGTEKPGLTPALPSDHTPGA